MYRHSEYFPFYQSKTISCHKCECSTDVYIKIERLDLFGSNQHKMIKGDLFENNFCIPCFNSIISDELKELK